MKNLDTRKIISVLVICLCHYFLFSQNPANILLNSAPANNAIDSYTRATNSIKLKPGFVYGQVNSGATNLLNLSIGLNPTFINSSYLGSGSNPGSISCNPVNPTSGKPVSETKGSFAVSPTGAALYDVPIYVSPGTAGVEPNLSVGYNSQAYLGSLGSSWNLKGVSSINRASKDVLHDGKYGGVTLTYNDIFKLDNNRLFALQGNYGANLTTYYPEFEDFSTITSYGTEGNGPQWFEVRCPNGVIKEYGKNLDSRLVGKNDNTVLSWFLNKVTDEFGNYMLYKYNLLDGEVTLDRVEYTGNSNALLSPYNSVQFEYMNTADKHSTYINGKEFIYSKIIKSITSYSENNLVKKYVFDYNWDTQTQLIKVTEVDAGGVALLPTTFCWNTGGPTMADEPSSFVISGSPGFAQVNELGVDIDGNGTKDKVAIFTDGSTNELRVFTNGGPGATPAFVSQYINSTPAEKVTEAYTADIDLNNSEELIFFTSPLGGNSNTYFLNKLTHLSTAPYYNISRTTFNTNLSYDFKPYMPTPLTTPFFYEAKDFTADGEIDELMIDPEKIRLTAVNCSLIFDYSTYGKSARPFNFDSDSEPEYIVFDESNPNTLTVKVLDLNIQSASLTQIYSYTFSGLINSQNFIKNIAIGDFNADDVSDLFIVEENYSDMGVCYGNGIALQPKVSLGTSFRPRTRINSAGGINSLNIYASDLNQDGFDDLTIDEYILTQSNWTHANYIPEEWEYNHHEGTWWKEPPANNQSDKELRTGTYFFCANNFIKGGFFSQFIDPQPGGGYVASFSGDYEGDGTMEMTMGPTGNYTAYDVNKCLIAINGKRKLSINQITTGFGSTLNFKYSNLNDMSSWYWNSSGNLAFDFQIYYKNSQTNYSGTGLFNYRPYKFCLTEVKQSNSQLTLNKTLKYTYSDAILCTKARGFLGFEFVSNYELPEETGGQNSHIFPTNKWKCSFDNYSFNNPCKVPILVETIEGKFDNGGQNQSGLTCLGQAGVSFLKKRRTYVFTPRNTGSFYVELTQSEEKDYLNSTHSKATMAYDLSNAGMLQTQTTTRGWESNILLTEQLTNNYASINGISKPILTNYSRTQQGQGAYLRSCTYGYDNQGHLTNTTNDPNLSNNSLITSYSNFNLFGQPQTITINAGDLPSARVSNNYYDAKGRFVVKTSNALGYTEEYDYDSKFGNLTQSKSITGLITTYTYDDLGRISQTQLPNGSTNNITYAFENINNFPYPSTASSIGIYSVKSQESGMPYVKEYYDSYDNNLRTETVGFNGSVILQDNKLSYKFDGNLTPSGLLIESSEPHFSGQATYGFQKLDYEPLAYRVSKQSYGIVNPTNPVPTIFLMYGYSNPSANGSYNKFILTSTDHLGLQKKLEFNGAGQNDVIRNIRGTLNQTVACVFDSNGGIKQKNLSNANGASFLYTYDNLGHQTQLIDPSVGTINYVYNTLGELIQQTIPATPLNHTHNFTYDVLGRILTKTGSSSGTTMYQYVTSGDGLGQIKKVIGPNGPNSVTTEYNYDYLGRIIQKKETVGSKVLNYDYTYDPIGNLTKYQFPNGFQVQQVFNSQGFLTQIKDVNNNLLWNLNAIDALGQITSYDYGNGITTSNVFNELGYLESINHGNIHKQEYDFNPVTDNLSKRLFSHFPSPGSVLKDAFSFDAAERLTKMEQIDPFNSTVIQTNNINYDVLGNITHKDDVGDYAYTNNSKPFTLSQLQNVTQNVNVNTLNIDYTDFNRPKHLLESVSNKEADIYYGNDEERVKMIYKISGVDQYTRYYGENYDRQEGASGGYKEWNYIYAPSGLCAINFNNNGNPSLLYALTDHLGSPILLTNQNQGVVEKYSFDAWGRRRNPNDWSYTNVPPAQYMIRGYTMHEQLEEFGIVNMNARLYDPLLGRILQPDNVIQDEENLQNFNRYSYVLNNPLKYTDPTGNEYEDDFGDSGFEGGPGLPSIKIILGGPQHEFWTDFQILFPDIIVPGGELPEMGVTTNLDDILSAWRTLNDDPLDALLNFTDHDYTDFGYDGSFLIPASGYDYSQKAISGKAGDDFNYIRNGKKGNPFSRAGELFARDWNRAPTADKVEFVSSFVSGAATLFKTIYRTAKLAKKSSDGFGSLMDEAEAERYAKYWEMYAPNQIAPGNKRMDWFRYSGRTGRLEKSRVIYDDYGRQIYRVDYSNHMRPIDHSIPHLHQYEFGPGYGPNGKETLFNFW